MEIKNIFKLENRNWIVGSTIVAVLVLLPILFLIKSLLKIQESDLVYLINTILFEYTLNTFYLIIITSFFSLIFGVLPAWYISKYKFIGRTFLDLTLYLPLAIPSYIMAFTYSDILSFTGPIQSFLRTYFIEISDIFNLDYLQIEVLGIILALALYPYIYSASRISFSLIGVNYINLSKSLGLSKAKSFSRIFLPLSKPAIFSGLFLVIMEVLNEYGAVKYFGVNTYTSGIFRAWFSMNNVGTAIQLSIILLIVVLLFIYFEKLISAKSKYNYSVNSKRQNLRNVNKKKLLFLYLVCGLPVIFGFFIPVVFIIQNVIFTYFQIDFYQLIELIYNSIKVSTFASFLIILIALLFLFIEKITKSKINYFMSQLISLGYALPGAVIGLSLILMFTSINKIFPSLSIIGSFYLLIYAYVIRFLAVGKSPIKASLDKHPDSYTDTAKNLGLSPLMQLKEIFLPINKFALLTAFIVTFIDLMKELPITLILRPFNFDTLGTQTYEYAIEEMIPLSSIYSLTIIIISSVMLLFLKNIINKQINVPRS